MIHTVLRKLQEELSQEIDGVVIDDIAKEDKEAINDKVVITLLNIQEEPTLKNNPRYEQIENKEYLKKNPPAYLNLYVMISANRSTYEKSLIEISNVIEIFQTKKVLVYDKEETEFKIQLHSLPLEQLSYAWGVLGGKTMPSALYKVSIIKIQRKGIWDVNMIQKINIESIKINEQ